jgi:hypothetical protein
MSCDNSGKAVWQDGSSDGAPYPIGVTIYLPLCVFGPGNFGWSSWDPAAGTVLPAWIPLEPGKKQSAINNMVSGDIYLLPVFRWLCGTTTAPTNGVQDRPYGCTDSYTATNLPGLVNDDANGNWKWAFVEKFLAFQLDHWEDDALTNSTLCGSEQKGASSNSKSQQCMVGKFLNLIASGVVVGNTSGSVDSSDTTYGVQLIR